jgi:hypothetical protein
MGRKKPPPSAMRRLHRSFGAGAAIFVLFMVISGITINHSNGLGLEHRQVSQPFLLDWYGLGKPDKVLSFELDGDWLSFAGSQLYLNEKAVATITGGVGAVASGNLLIAAGGDELLLLDHDGNLVERMPWSAIGPAPVDAIGLDANGRVLVKTGDQLWSSDAELLNWRNDEATLADPRWSTSKPADEVLQRAINNSYRGDGLSLERVILDLHSGRIFGSIGVLVYDLLALALGFLAISGLVLWTRSRRKGKSNSSRGKTRRNS